MRFNVLLTEDAERDLEDIYTYIAEHDCRQKADYVLDRLIEVGPTDEETFSPRGEHDLGAVRVDCGARGPDARLRLPDLVKRPALVAGCILNRKPGDACRCTQRHVLEHFARAVPIARFVIGIHRQIGRRDDRADVRQHSIARHSPIGVRESKRERCARTRGRKRLKP